MKRLVAPVMGTDHSPVLASRATDTDELLITAAKNGNVDMIEMMLKLKPNIDANQPGVGTALNVAIKSGNSEAVTVLLMANANPNMLKDCWSPLKDAVYLDSIDMARVLLKAGADPCLNEKGSSPFIMAAENINLEMVSEMLSHKPDINLVNPDPASHERTALSIAAHNGQLNMVKLLLEHGAKIKDGYVLDVAEQGHVNVLQPFGYCGADIRAYDKFGNTSLIWAASKGHIEVVKMLLSILDVDVEYINHKNNTKGGTTLRYAAKHGYTAIMDALLGANVGATVLDKDNGDALKIAVWHGHLETVKRLFAAPEVNIESPGYGGATALCTAAERGHERIVKFLLDNGANSHARSGPSSVLMAAVKANQTGIAKMLMDKGANS